MAVCTEILLCIKCALPLLQWIPLGSFFTVTASDSQLHQNRKDFSRDFSHIFIYLGLVFMEKWSLPMIFWLKKKQNLYSSVQEFWGAVLSYIQLAWFWDMDYNYSLTTTTTILRFFYLRLDFTYKGIDVFLYSNSIPLTIHSLKHYQSTTYWNLYLISSVLRK